jgi:hypothetical protein
MSDTATETEAPESTVETQVAPSNQSASFNPSEFESALFGGSDDFSGDGESTGEGGESPDGGDGNEPPAPTLKSTEEQKAIEDEFGEAPGKSEKSQSGWAKLKEAKKLVETERDTFKGELDTLKAELERLKAEPRTQQNSEEINTIRAELEANRKKAEEYEKRVALIDVEQTDEFQQNIAIPLVVDSGLVALKMFVTQREVGDVCRVACDHRFRPKNA